MTWQEDSASYEYFTQENLLVYSSTHLLCFHLSMYCINSEEMPLLQANEPKYLVLLLALFLFKTFVLFLSTTRGLWASRLYLSHSDFKLQVLIQEIHLKNPTYKRQLLIAFMKHPVKLTRWRILGNVYSVKGQILSLASNYLLLRFLG